MAADPCLDLRAPGANLFLWRVDINDLVAQFGQWLDRNWVGQMRRERKD